MKKDNLKFVILVIALISVIMCISGFGLATWARYRTATGGNVTAEIAKWSFKVNKSSTEFAEIDLAKTIHYDHVVDTTIAPGTQGSFDLEIDGTGSEVSLDYYINMLVAQKPTNMKFYTDSTHTTPIIISADNKMFLDGELLLSGAMKEIRTIYWDWAYRTNTLPTEAVLSYYSDKIDGLTQLINEYQIATTDTDKQNIAMKINDKIDTKEAGGQVLIQVNVRGVQINPEFALKGIQITSDKSVPIKEGDIVTLSVEFTESVYADNSKTGINSSTAPVVKVGFDGTATASNPVAKVASLVSANLRIAEGENIAKFEDVEANKINYSYVVKSGDKGNIKIESIEGIVYNQFGKELRLTAENTKTEIIGETIKTSKYNIGDSINWSTTLNGVTLNNWKKFYEEDGKTYLIYGDYLPNSAVSDDIKRDYNLAINGTYSIYSTTNRDDLMNAMTTRDNWSAMLNGTLDGKSYNYVSNESYMAQGSPNLELYVKAWNIVYPNDKLYWSKNEVGYFVGDTENPSTYVFQTSNVDELYCPYTYAIDGSKCYGYWLSSFASDGHVMRLTCDGLISTSNYNYVQRAFRPIISLPTSIIEGTTITNVPVASNPNSMPEAKSEYAIGESVPWSTTLNNQTLNNWKMFYEEDGKSYLIYGDYLPNVAVSDTIKTNYHLATNGSYGIYGTSNRNDLMNAMIARDNWKNLLNGTLNGKNLNYSTDVNYIAQGSPDLEFYINVWNKQYLENKLYYAKNSIGYCVGNNDNPTTYYVQKSNSDRLFYPFSNAYNSCSGYWLASFSAEDNCNVMRVSYLCYLDGNAYDDVNYAFRPIICLPSSILKK